MEDEETASSEGDGSGHIASDATQTVLLPRDKQRKTALYDYATERQTSHTEAKQFYQRLLQENQGIGGATWPQGGISPIIKAKTFSHSVGLDSHRASRANSLHSQRSIKNRAYTAYNKLSLPQPTLDEDQIPRDSKAGAFPTSPPGAAQTESEEYHEGDEAFNFPDQNTKESYMRSAVPQSQQPPPIATGSLPGAGVGTGLGSALGGFAANDDTVAAELSAIYTNIQRVLDIRRKYIQLSLQGPIDNPKDDPDWRIYPPPPEPVWYHSDGKQTQVDGSSEPSTSQTLSRDSATRAPESPKSQRKMIQDIGSDFDMDELMPSAWRQ